MMAGEWDVVGQHPASGDGWGVVSEEPLSKPLSTGDYIKRKVTQSAASAMQGGAILTGGLAGALGLDTLRDRLFENAVGLGEFQRDQTDGTGTNDAAQSRGQRLVGAVAGAVPMIAAGVVNPALALAPMSLQSMGQTGDQINSGVDAKTAGKVFATDTAGSIAGMFLPPGVGKSAKAMVASGAGMNVAQGLVTDAVKRKILSGAGYDEQAKALDPTNADARLVDALMGAAFGYHGARASGATGSQAANARDFAASQERAAAAEAVRSADVSERTSLFDAYRPILEANGITSPDDPRLKQAANALAARDARKQQAASESEGVPPSPEELALASAGRPDVMQVDSQGRVDAGDRGALAGLLSSLGTKAVAEKQAAQAFDLADARQRRADADLANTGELAPDYQGGGAASGGGVFDAGKRIVTLLDARTGKGGKLADGLAVEPMDPTRYPPSAYGNVVVQDGAGNIFEVPVARLSEHELPAAPRQAQDFMARSNEPPRGVGVETMAGENMPHRSTDRIAGDEIGGLRSAVDPNGRDAGGPHEGTVEQAPIPPKGLNAPREGQTVEGEVVRDPGTSVVPVPGTRRSSSDIVPPDSSRAIGHDKPAGELPAPESEQPGRMVTDSQGNARPATYADNNPGMRQAHENFRNTHGQQEGADSRRPVTQGARNAEAGQAESIPAGRGEEVARQGDAGQRGQEARSSGEPEGGAPRGQDGRGVVVGDEADKLRDLGSRSGWAERGGYVIRDPKSGEVSGRTQWVPNDYWWEGMPRNSKGSIELNPRKLKLFSNL